MARIDLNADMGESFGPWRMGDDAAMLEIVTSANIACGFHAGDPLTMARTVGGCALRGVCIGAHPGFDDLRGFGRRRISGDGDDFIEAMIAYQIGALEAVARRQGARLTHVKLHGALANMASESPSFARLCLGAVKRAFPALPVIAMAATALHMEAEKLKMRAVREVYADRAYEDDGTLKPRGQGGAVIDNPAEAADRALRMVETQKIRSVNGVEISVMPETICIHGDGPQARAMAEAVRERLEKNGVAIKPFAQA